MLGGFRILFFGSLPGEQKRAPGPPVFALSAPLCSDSLQKPERRMKASYLPQLQKMFVPLLKERQRL